MAASHVNKLNSDPEMEWGGKQYILECMF